MDAAVLERTIPQVRDEHGRINLDAVNRLTEDEMATWVSARLHGDDDRVPLDVRGDESRHSLFLNIYPRLNEDGQVHLRRSAMRAVEDMSANGAAWQGEAGHALLMLVGALFRTASEQPIVAEHVQKVAYSRFGSSTGEMDMSLRALQTLIAIDYLVDGSVWRKAYELGGDRSANLVVAGIGRRSITELDDWICTTRATVTIEHAIVAQSPALARWHGRDQVISFLGKMRSSGRFSPRFAEVTGQIVGVLPE